MSSQKTKNPQDHISSLDGEKYLAAIDPIFFRDGYLLAGAIMGHELSGKSLLFLTRKLYSEINSLTDSFIGRCRLENRRVDCRQGCSFCCHQAVLIVPHEAFYMEHYMRESIGEGLRGKITERIREKDRVTCLMKVQEFLHYKAPCPFLEDDCCTIYPARPMACRIYLSEDSHSCEYEFSHPSDRDYFPGLYEFPLHAGRMMNEGICAWLQEKKIYTTEWQLESSMNTILNTDDCLGKWLGGENIFQTRNYSDAEISYLHGFSQPGPLKKKDPA
jgi:Fe-S-cluster containining protein